jgi:hypothetical protein
MSPLISTRAGASAYGYGGLVVASAAGADYELIEKRVLSSNSASVSFNSISQNYKHLQFFADLRNTDGGTVINTSVYFNGDTTGSNYQRHFFQNAFSGPALTSGGAANGTYNYMYAAGQAYSANTATNHLNIYDYTSTSKNKTLTNVSMFLNNGSGSGVAQGFGGLYTGMWRNTSAITSVTFEANSSALESGSTFWLYGIKG